METFVSIRVSMLCVVLPARPARGVGGGGGDEEVEGGGVDEDAARGGAAPAAPLGAGTAGEGGEDGLDEAGKGRDGGGASRGALDVARWGGLLPCAP